MAGKLVQGKREAQHFLCPTDGSTAITRGALLFVDATVAAGGVVRLANGSLEDTTTDLFVADQTVASSATVVQATLVEPGQVWLWDTANAVNTNQQFKKCVMSTSLLLNNTSTTNTSKNGVWTMLFVSGATANNQLLCIPHILGQVAA